MNQSSKTGMRRWRGIKDRFSRYFVGAGGISVILALALIFVYLFSEVAPMLLPPSVERLASYTVPGYETNVRSKGNTLHVAMERYREVAVRFADDGSVTFFNPVNGDLISEMQLPIPEDVTITSIAAAEPRTRMLVLGLSDGSIVLVQHEYDLTYPDDVRLVTPKLSYPFGEEPIVAIPPSPTGMGDNAIIAIGTQRGTDGSVVVALATEDHRLRLLRFSVRRTLFASEVSRQEVDLEAPASRINHLMLSIDMGDLIVGDEQGYVHYFDITRIAQSQRVESVRVLDAPITAMQYLLGTVSLIIGGADGSITQWMLVRDDDNVRHLREVRSFRPHSAAVTAINPEQARKGFVTADATGEIALHFSTSEQTLLAKHVVDAPIRLATFAPRADGLFVLDANEQLHFYEVNNPHPQASISAL